MKRISKETATKLFFVVAYLVLSIGYMALTLQNKGLVAGHDFRFHLNRILGLTNSFSAPLNFEWFSGYGIPINVFYGWLWLYPWQLLYRLSGSLVISYNLYGILLTFVTFLICHYSFYKIKGQHFASHLFALLYTFSLYRSTCFFTRAAYGESLAMTFLPLFFLGVYQLFFTEKARWLTLAIALSLLFYAHVISTILCLVVLLVVYGCFVWRTWGKKKQLKKVTLQAMKAGGLFLGLTAWFWGPMLEQFLNQSITRPTIYSLQERGLSPANTIIGSLNNQQNSYTIGLILLLVMLLLMINFKKLKLQQRQLFLISVFLFLLTTNLWTWNIYQHTFFSLMQFPWRLTSFVTLLLAFLGADFVSENYGKKVKQPIWLVGLAGLLLVLNYSSLYNYTAQKEVLIQEPQAQARVVNYHTHDYAPKGYQAVAEQMKNVEVRANDRVIASEKVTQPDEVLFKFTTATNEVVTLPVYQYKGLQVTINGKAVTDIPNETTTPLIKLKSEAGANTIRIRYRYTIWAQVCLLISLTTLLVLLLYLFFGQKLGRYFFHQKK